MKNLGILLLSLLAFQTVHADECLRTRGVLDIGSNSTKAKVAVVNVCTQKIDSVLMEEQSKKVAYAADLKDQLTQQQLGFSKKIKTEGLQAIHDLIQQGNAKAEKIEWRGFATSAFRISQDGAEVLAEWSRDLAIRLSVIDQAIEGALGFAAGIQVSQQTTSDETIVWDIGGGSQQLSYIDRGKVVVLQLENLGAEKFKELLIRQIKGEAGAKLKTPNPIGAENIIAGKNLAAEIARKVQLPFTPKEIIGIGGVHSKAIIKATGRKTAYRSSDLDTALVELSLKTDEELNDKFADTFVSNILLVSGFMAELQFNEILVSSFSTTDGALVFPALWK